MLGGDYTTSGKAIVMVYLRGPLAHECLLSYASSAAPLGTAALLKVWADYKYDVTVKGYYNELGRVVCRGFRFQGLRFRVHSSGLTRTPKVGNIIASMAIIMGLGPLFYILLGFR